MQPQNLSLSLPTTLNPNFSLLSSKFSNPLILSLPTSHKPRKPLLICSNFFQNANGRPDMRAFAGRSKAKPGGTGSSGGRIEGVPELLREAKRNARRRTKKYSDSFFYRLKNPHKNYPDNFTEEELQMIGLGYDRFVRFMEKDDPNLKHPYDWYKYGEFGPYSWRGVVLGDPVRGRFTDERVSMIGEVKDQEEWDEIEQHDMLIDYRKKVEAMDQSKRKRYYWVFVRHPKWRVSDLPWQQWTLVCQVALEAGEQRLDKWTLMGRLGNKARALITQCAAWMRPDIIYVKRPVYQCRFEPQEEFFAALAPLLDPESEEDYMCEMENEDGSVELCTYFGGLCKMLRVSSKAFVDDVVNKFEKSSDEKKSKVLEFLLNNHPVMLLHPWTKEWKAKLEDIELGCDAPDEDDVDSGENEGGNEIVSWIEDDENDDADDGENVEDEGEDDDEGEDEDEVILDAKEEDEDEEEDPEYWEEEFKKAIRSNEAMEKLVEKSVKISNKYYARQMESMQEKEDQTVSMQRKEKEEGFDDGDELEMRGKRAKITPKEWKVLGLGPYRRKVKKSKIPPELFLCAAVRPFTYRHLVKEIVLTRHAIVDGDIKPKK